MPPPWGVSYGIQRRAVVSNPMPPTLGTARILMLRADLGTDTTTEDASVTTWTNQEGASGNAGATGSNKPTYKASGANGRPYLRFDKTTNPQHMSGTIALSGTSQTVFLVVHLDAHEAGNRRIMAFPAGTVNDISTGDFLVYDPNSGSDVRALDVVTDKSVVAMTAATVHVLMLKFDGTNSTSAVDGVAGTTVACTSAHTAAKYIIAAGQSGSATGYLPITGRVYEKHVWNVALSAGDITTNTDYLKTRYGIA